VSGFLCSCHGLFCHKSFVPGVNDEGWWTCDDLTKQLQDDALPTFERLHPGKEGYFIFDNSMNHQKRPADSLVATQLPLKDGGKNVPLDVRSGWYMCQNERVMQPMQTGKGAAKGLYTILRERGLLPINGTIRRQCKAAPCVTMPPFTCCAVTLLSTQPDFVEQKTMLEEVFENTPHQLDLLPKFHPEFNPIENFWGASKAYCRNNCDYTFSGLKETVPKALASVHLDKIRKFERRCIRFMQVYKIGLPPHLAEFAVKKYTSHRHIPQRT
jgi:hypothetical protein